jgi:uncharacterized protein (TIGR02265 family)
VTELKNGVIYKDTVETLINLVLRSRQLLTPDVQHDQLEIGVDTARLSDVYFATWVKLLEYCATLGTPVTSTEIAINRLGHRWIDGYFETFSGKAALLFARVVGPKKSLMTMADKWRATNNFYVATAVDRGPKHVDIMLNVGGAIRHFNAGIMERVLQMMGVTTGRVETTDVGGHSLFSITWS